MRMSRLIPVWAVLASLMPAGATTVPAAQGSPTPDDPLALSCELGITLALSGEYAAAESAFVSLLSRAPGDARALNNIGNLHLRRGDPELALAFYRKASAADSADAGIRLNEATALLLAGEERSASERAAEAVRMAGGTAPAADLLGLRLEERAAGERAADRTRISREEVIALLQAAAGAVPADSASAAPEDSLGAGTEGRRPAWRSAGARGAAAAELDAIVYWKR